MMCDKLQSFVVAGLLCVIAIAQPLGAREVILNQRAGGGGTNWDGHLKWAPRGWFLRDTRWDKVEFDQIGANTDSETVGSRLDHFDVDQISGNGLNKVTFTADISGTSNDVIGYYWFDTLPELKTCTVTTVAEYTWGRKLRDFYTPGSPGTVTVAVSGSVTTNWSESSTDTWGVDYTVGGGASWTARGSIGIDSFKLESGQSSQISSSMTTKAESSRTTQKSGSDVKSVAYTKDEEVGEGQTIYVYCRILVTRDLIEAEFYPDGNNDGLADSDGSTTTAKWHAYGEPVAGTEVEIRASPQ